MILKRTVLDAVYLFLVLTLGWGCVGMPPLSQAVVLKRAQMHMGTLVSITVVAPTDRIGQAAIAAGFAEIKRLEQLLSTWIPDSELSRVNQAAGLHPVTVSRETMELVVRSLEIAGLTEGGLNIALGPAVEVWSVTERQRIPTETEQEALRLLVDWSLIELDRQTGSIFLPRPGMRIDVGGIGKGYTADLVANVLQQAGVTGGVVALAGDIKTFGDQPGAKGFEIGIRHPRKEGAIIATIELQNEAISTAGDYERYFEQDGVRYHHILDPISLEPARKCQSVTVVAKEGTMADGLDTGIFVLGPERGMALVERLPDVEAVIIDDQGRITVSSGLQGRLRYQ